MTHKTGQLAGVGTNVATGERRLVFAAVKERPIIMTAESVRAILAGHKTQTRRVVNPQPVDDGREVQLYWRGGRGWDLSKFQTVTPPYGEVVEHRVEFHRLWVRESHWRFTGVPPVPGDFVASPDGDPYEARCYDDNPQLAGLNEACALLRVPSIHMPRWASRLTLEVVAVRVERLQEITEADALAEGAHDIPVDSFKPRLQGCLSERAAYAQIWDRINGKRHPWASNPWVWVIEFRRAP